jgi:hypothetical protein
LINNAAQTIDRPNDFYNHLLLANPDVKMINSHIINPTHKSYNYCKKMIVNNDNDSNDNNNLILEHNNNNNLILEHNTELFPLNKYDQFGQQIDLRKENSWILEIDEIEIKEFLKVQAVNNFTPFVFVNKFLPLLKRDCGQCSWIINVSSMEGIFNWKYKSSRHVHTNMAKSSLNMMTRTCGEYLFEKYNVVMCAVETGWNNSQFPLKPQKAIKSLFMHVRLNSGFARI